MSEGPTWVSEMLRHHRRASMTLGWRNAIVLLAVFAFLAWACIG